ncbi:TPA: hypothetical protein DDW35_08360, partial [Candidatus Sumerlaeota bacterium]|nr:hypothetical protein [Candidatus Sumerlaeota bacterium]
LQDHFAEATGVASIISNVDGTPITRPSNFCRLCSKIRATEKGKANCYCSDAALGCFHPNGPIIQHCLSGGLWDAGASISVGGHHIANWLIGQVRDESQSVDKIREYAKQIGLDEEEAVTAFLEVPAMPLKRFENVSQTLFVMATQLSVIAYQNLQQARFITDQKLGAEALRASEAKFRRITTNIEDIVYSVDAKTWEYLYISPAFERILGYNWEDVQAAGGRRAFLPQIMPPELFEQQEQTFKQQTAAQNTTLPCQSEGWWCCKNGSKRYLEDRWILVYEADELVSCDGVLRDITERKMAEEQRNALQRQMEQTQRLESLGVLAGGIAHDFNNLLMGILGYADLAIEEISPMSPARESLGEIDKAARRAADLCRQMLAYSGKGKFVIELIHLRDLVAEMTHLLKTTISKKVELVLDLENSIPPMEGDSSQIRQVVMNLITNASEAIGDQAGTIRITTGIQACTTQDLANSYIDDNLSAGEYVYIEVADTGCGMARETLNHLFDPFFTTKFTGRGLGMAAVLGIVRGHKGAIKIQSEVGRGTTFQVFFPAHQPKKDDQKTTTESDEDQWKSSGTVLLVDDEETIRVLGERMLRRLGFRIIIASDGQEAVRIYGKQQAEIDYVVLDLTMPRMDGEETYQALCRINPKVRVIMSSGYTEQEISTRFAGKGLAGFLQKPYSLSALKRVFSPIK